MDDFTKAEIFEVYSFWEETRGRQDDLDMFCQEWFNKGKD